jgi:SAM-dependent methyltransferase
VDDATLDIYEREAEAIFRRHTSAGRQRAVAHFIGGGATADIGSGSGRDLAWLNANGFPAVGYEPVAALRALCLAEFPDVTVFDAALPALEGIADASFDNVLCSAVVMHLPAESVPMAVKRLTQIVRPGGRLLVAFRRGLDGAERENDGRLFTPIEGEAVVAQLIDLGFVIREHVTENDPDRPGISWTVIAAAKGSGT